MDVRICVCLCVFVFFSLQMSVVKSLTLTWDEKQHIDYAEINIRPKHARARREADNGGDNDDGILPTDIEMDFEMNKENISFHLRRNDRVAPNAPVYLIRDGGIKRMDIPQRRKTAFYQDVASGAAVEIECARSDKHECRHLVRGTFKYRNESVMIEPEENEDENDEDETKPRKRTDTLIRSRIHRVFKTEFQPDYRSDYIVPEGKSLLLPPAKHFDLLERFSRNKRSIVDYQVEFLCVVDFPIYNFWYNSSNATTDAARSGDAIESIREFYAFVVNAIDLRYQSIVSSQINIDVLFGGIIIAQAPSDSPWTENNKTPVTGARDQVDSGVALNAFKDWIPTQTSFPEYDHVMAFTGYDLTNDGSTSNAGLAWVGGTCDFTRNIANSISEDHFGANVAIVAAHELGHNLGVSHDGDGNACLANDKYVMSPSFGGITDARALNHWIFSTCSVTMFETYIAQLNEANNNCLLNFTTSYDPSATTSYQDLMPGQEYDIDTQCEIVKGSGSFFCRSLHTSAASACPVMWCKVPGSSSCQTVIPWEGTSCGNNMWCQAGVCVNDTRAPTRNDMCVHGNQPGIVNSGMTCDQLISSNPANCYQSSFSTRCCESCAPYYTGCLGCEYGDSASGCTLAHCAENPILCCGTCNTPCLTTTSATGNNYTTTPSMTSAATSTSQPGSSSTSTTSVVSTASPGPTTTSNGTGSSAHSSALDNLCASLYNAASSACRYFHYSNYSTVCSTLYCHTVTNPDTCTGISPPNNTPCGSGKWCISGSCVPATSAPDLSPTCPFGDEIAPVYNGSTCSQYVPSNTINCYLTSWQGMCCATCGMYYIGIPGCEYGDRATGCVAGSCPQYDATTRNTSCCATCATTTTTTTTTAITPSTTPITATTPPLPITNLTTTTGSPTTLTPNTAATTIAYPTPTSTPAVTASTASPAVTGVTATTTTTTTITTSTTPTTTTTLPLPSTTLTTTTASPTTAGPTIGDSTTAASTTASPTPTSPSAVTASTTSPASPTTAATTTTGTSTASPTPTPTSAVTASTSSPAVTGVTATTTTTATITTSTTPTTTTTPPTQTTTLTTTTASSTTAAPTTASSTTAAPATAAPTTSDATTASPIQTSTPAVTASTSSPVVTGVTATTNPGVGVGDEDETGHPVFETWMAGPIAGGAVVICGSVTVIIICVKSAAASKSAVAPLV